MKRIITLVAILTAGCLHMNGQTFDPFSLFGKGKLFKLNGGVNASMLYNYSSNNSFGGTPFTYVVGGNLNLYVKGINIPLDFTYSNAQVAVRFQPIPFNKIAIHPRYKSFTFHAGTIAMTFTPYTLNGFQFNGAGVDYAPGKFKLSVLGGKFLRGSGDYFQNPDAPPTYSRTGMGIASSYQFDKMFLGVNVFYAKDDTSSAQNIPVEQGIKPKQNLVASLVTNGDWKGFKYNIELANSLMTTDQTSPLAYKGSSAFSGLLNRNGTTGNKQAQNIRITRNIKTANFGMSYEKVDFNYETLGSLYVTNGFENTAITFRMPFFKQKLNLSAQLGIQHMLANKEDTAVSQKTSSQLTNISITYTPTQKLSFNGSYSNNKGVTDFRNLNNIANQNNLIPVYLDSLRLVQLNTNMSVNASYQLQSTPTENRALSASYSYQKGDQQQGDFFLDLQGTAFQNATVGLFTVYPKTGVKWNMNLNYSSVQQGPDSNNTKAIGFNFNFGKKIFRNRVMLTIGSGYNTTKTAADALRVNVVNFRVTASYTIRNKHVFNLNTIVQNNARRGIITPYSTTSTGIFSLNYNYSF